jgi:hypothetical protein
MSRKLPPAFALFDAWTRIALEAQSIITYRVLGNAGFFPLPANENNRMVAEKWKAAADAGFAAWSAAALGGAPMAVALAYARPYGTATRGNARRLGPKLGTAATAPRTRKRAKR